MAKFEEEVRAEDGKYLTGKSNQSIRYYFYLNQGLTVLNNFRNLFLGIVGLYIALKLTNPLWIVGMIVVSLPILGIVGYYNVHKISKVQDWLTIRFGSHYGIRQFDYMKGQYEQLTELVGIIKRNEKNL